MEGREESAPAAARFGGNADRVHIDEGGFGRAWGSAESKGIHVLFNIFCY